jgi:3-methyl-2-oxobutanoate hydroxymethyltransferase
MSTYSPPRLSDKPAGASQGRPVRRRSVPELRSRKGGEPIVCLTAYTAPMARLLDPAADLLMIGDSLGMVIYGMPSTLGVTMEMMVAHTAAVVAGSEQACIIADLPFGAYQASPSQAFAAAARLMVAGASGVKLEGGVAMAETVRFLVDRGIPVMGHVGLTPQSVQALGGYGPRGRGEAEAAAILADAVAVEAAGAFSIVIEGTLEPLARTITERLAIPTIGIGASAACDGQVLVTEDMLGLSGDRVPKFVRAYANLGGLVAEAAAAYASDVRARRFPGEAETYRAKQG